MKTKTKIPIACILLSFCLLSFSGFAKNRDISNYLINLSEGPEGPGYSDVVPEMIISGNTIHVIWVQSPPSNVDVTSLYYCRSTDLGETWEVPKLIKEFKDTSIPSQVNSRRLAVDGGNVHICAADYDYGDKGTGRLYYFRSQNSGSSFENEKIIAATSGGYKKIYNSFIKASNGKIAVAYQGEGDKKGTRVMFSSNGGATFSETKISDDSDESSYVADLYFDGSQMIVLHGYTYYHYGLYTGKLWASVSGDGKSFKTNKISVRHPTQYGERERCICSQDNHYVPKIARSGNNVHIVFAGYKDEGFYTFFYSRSTNSGASFEPATALAPSSSFPGGFQSGSETVAAMGNQVYVLAASAYPMNNNIGNQFYLIHSENNGATLSEPRTILNPDIAHVGKASLPGVTIDTKDASGKTLYLTGNWLFSTKSVDGGLSFSGSTMLAPSLNSNIIDMSHNYMNSYFALDADGVQHWISSAQWRSEKDNDIFYRNVKAQPEPGSKNKALYVEQLAKSYQTELVAVPSSQSINFDSAMTAEVWVKFNPETESNFSILAKVNGYDGYFDQPKGYQMGFQQEKGKIKINAGIKTDKGEFVNKSEFDLNDNLWHHIAFTYDANGGLNNFKLYINGLLQIEKTVTGILFAEDGMLLIGSRSMGNGWYYDTKYLLDDVRLWNRALTQKELIANQTKKLSGKENGLKLFMNFDDTFKDISGNGNDGIPVYNGTLEVSDFDPPVAAFEMYQLTNELTFNNKTKNASSWLWDFGDKSTSQLGNPKYTYTTSGEYSVSLLAKNATTVTAAIGHVTIEGLDRVEPQKAGNAGFVTITVFGGALTPVGTEFILRKEGSADIKGGNLYSPAPGQLAGHFLMTGAKIGKWNVVVKKDGKELILSEAFNVVEAIQPDPWVSVSGRGLILFNMWQTYAINYGNKGNVDALGVPLNIAISDLPGMDIEFIDFKVEANEYMKKNTPRIVELMDTLYTVVEDYFGPGKNARFYPLYVPVVKSNSSKSIHIRIKSPGDFNIETWTHKPFFQTEPTGTKSAGGSTDDWPDEKTKLNACIALSGMNAASSVAMDALGLVLPVDCVHDFAMLVFNPWDAAKPEFQKSEPVQHWGYGLAAAAISCVGDLSPIKAIKIGIKLTSIVNNMYEGYKAHQECLNAFDPRYKNKKGVRAVSSFDPNEMIGPSGFGTQNYIAKYNLMPYTVLFENKSTATAPAHVVTITDTLDLSKFDISEFGFGSFGWDTLIFNPLGNKLKEFSMDIDMRPGTNLITRVSGKLDTITGIIKWDFLSLNPSTMNLEEDPFIGFLPPNKTSPQGEGFVSFSVGLKKELKTNAEIRNKASIVFDANPPIITNNYLNTLDLDVPESKVYSLGARLENHFMVEWTGSDKGSGIQHYSIYVLENDTLLYPWIMNTTALSAPFEEGQIGSNYKFYSIATDNIGLIENAPNDYDAATTITVDVKEFERVKEELTVWPNPAKDNLQVSFTNAPCGVYVVELVAANGTLKHSQIYTDLELQNGADISVLDCTPGQYVLRIVYGNKTETRKIIVQK